jgi:CRP/FNR family cyclic AMP-dependent transcriptional regulator
VTSRQEPSAENDQIDKLTFISRHPFFVGLPIDIQKRAVGFVKSKRYAIGEMIFSKGDFGSCLFIVYKGMVKIEAQSYEGKEVVFNLIKKGECFGEIAALDGLPRTANASAFTSCELLIIDRRDLVLLMEIYPP